MLSKKKGLIIKPSELEGFILSEYGIKCGVAMLKGKQIIKVSNHLTLYALINKIRRKCDFTVHHKKNKNEFIIVINEM